jgi:hypothetical protein
MKQVLSKISTITRKAREANPVKYNELRDRTLDIILNSKPNMNVKILISSKPF